jgi:hypothetical protein
MDQDLLRDANDTPPSTSTTASTPPDDSKSQTVVDPAKEQPFDTAPKYRISAWVQGGTTSSEHDQQVQRRRFEAEERRRKQDTERRMSHQPIDQGGAKMHSVELASAHDPKILLRYVNGKKETEMEILCELVQDEGAGTRILTVCCPECVKRGMPMDQAQFHIREGHRKWSVDTREMGQPRRYTDVDYFSGQSCLGVYISAGKIMDTETLRCPHFNCGVTYKIHDNMLYRVWKT